MVGFLKRWMSAAGEMRAAQNELRECAAEAGFNWMHVNPEITKLFVLLAREVGGRQSFDLFNAMFNKCVSDAGWDKIKANQLFLKLCVGLTEMAEKNPSDLYLFLKEDFM